MGRLKVDSQALCCNNVPILCSAWNVAHSIKFKCHKVPLIGRKVEGQRRKATLHSAATPAAARLHIADLHRHTRPCGAVRAPNTIQQRRAFLHRDCCVAAPFWRLESRPDAALSIPAAQADIPLCGWPVGMRSSEACEQCLLRSQTCTSASQQPRLRPLQQQH